MSGLSDWFEIFKGGMQKDDLGRIQDGDKFIDSAIASFDSARHEPPVVVGHPVSNAPAFGWVEGLKSVVKGGTKVLLAKCKNVVPEFEQAVKQGLYKKRSASFYRDGSLRHVGFLGAMPPAVKGLADLKFEDSDGAVTFESNFSDGGKEMSKFKEQIKSFLTFLGVDASRIPDDALPAALPEGAAAASFSEVDVLAREKAAREKAEKETRDKVAAEFAESARNERKQARKQEIVSFCDVGVKAGRILPAWVKLGLPAFMESLDAEGAVQFSEGDGGKKTPYEFFRAFMEELPKVVEFREVAARQGAEFSQSSEEKEQHEAGLRIAARVNPVK